MAAAGTANLPSLAEEPTLRTALAVGGLGGIALFVARFVSQVRALCAATCMHIPACLPVPCLHDCDMRSAPPGELLNPYARISRPAAQANTGEQPAEEDQGQPAAAPGRQQSPAPARSPSPGAAARLAVAAERADELSAQAREMRAALEDVSRSLAAVREARQAAAQQLAAAASAGAQAPQLTEEEQAAAELRAVSWGGGLIKDGRLGGVCSTDSGATPLGAAAPGCQPRPTTPRHPAALPPCRSARRRRRRLRGWRQMPASSRCWMSWRRSSGLWTWWVLACPWHAPLGPTLPLVSACPRVPAWLYS